MAAVDYFLKIDDVEGESHDHKYKGWIQIESFSWGASQKGAQSSGGGGGAGKVKIQDVHFVMKVNKASPKLMLACANGDHYKEATLICRKAGGKQADFYKLQFSDVLVSTYVTGGSGHGDLVPHDQVSLNFGKIEMEYREQKHDGTLGPAVKAGWNAKTNSAV